MNTYIFLGGYYRRMNRPLADILGTLKYYFIIKLCLKNFKIWKNGKGGTRMYVQFVIKCCLFYRTVVKRTQITLCNWVRSVSEKQRREANERPIRREGSKLVPATGRVALLTPFWTRKSIRPETRAQHELRLTVINSQMTIPADAVLPLQAIPTESFSNPSIFQTLTRLVGLVSLTRLVVSIL